MVKTQQIPVGSRARRVGRGLVPEVAPGFPKCFCDKLLSGFGVPVVKKAAPVAKDLLTRVAADDCEGAVICVLSGLPSWAALSHPARPSPGRSRLNKSSSA